MEKFYTLPFSRTIFDEILSSSFHDSQKTEKYPFYDIYSKDDKHYIDIAVSGFKESEIKISFDDDGDLLIEGSKEKEKAEIKYFAKNISTRSFKRKFALMKYVKVNSVKLNDGILSVELVRNKTVKQYIEINKPLKS